MAQNEFGKDMAVMDEILSKGLKSGVFSAAALVFFRKSTVDFEKRIIYKGRRGVEVGYSAIDGKSLFDLASLTKPLAVTLLVSSMLDRQELELEATLGSYYQDLNDWKKDIRLGELLNHCSGLAAHHEFWPAAIGLDSFRKRFSHVRDAIFASVKSYQPGSQNLYSDLGYILLGDILEKAGGTSLDELFRKRIAEPLGLGEELGFFGGGAGAKKDPEIFVISGRCPYTGKILQGKVHDDNCRLVGGIAGHAGLFATVDAVFRLSSSLIRLYHGVCEDLPLSHPVFKRLLDEKVGSRRGGFDTPTGPYSSSGSFFSKNTIGHLGFTGTSLWLDLEQKQGIILLTNRTIYDNGLAGIRKLRPSLHDAVQELWAARGPG